MKDLISSSLFCILFLSSCNQSHAERKEVAVPRGFSVTGPLEVYKYLYGGALGGYRYKVYLTDNNQRKLIFNGRTNRELTVSFVRSDSVVLDFCQSGNRHEPGKTDRPMPGVEVIKYC